PRHEDRERWTALAADLVEAKRRADERRKSARGDFDKWLADVKPESVASSVPSKGLRFHAPLGEGKGNEIAVEEDGKPRALKLAKAPAWQPGRVADHALKVSADSIVEVPGAGDFDIKQPFAFGAWVKLPKANLGGALLARMDDGNNYRGWDLWVERGR